MTHRLLLPGFNFSLMMWPGFIPRSFMCLSSISCASHLRHALSKTSFLMLRDPRLLLRQFWVQTAGKHQESQTPGCSSTTSMQSKPFSMNAATYWWKPFALLNAPSTSAYIGGAKLHEKPGGFSLATFCDPLERSLVTAVAAVLFKYC